LDFGAAAHRLARPELADGKGSIHTLGVFAVAVLGLGVGRVVWIASRALAADRPLVAGPACAVCAVALPLRGWLPLMELGGAVRCRACGARQPAIGLLFEFLVAAYFAVAAWQLGLSLDLAATLVFSVPLLVTLLVDLWTRDIYTGVVIAGTLAGFAFALADGPRALVIAVLAALGAAALFALFFVVAAAIYRQLDVVPFGLGDVYLVTMIGAMTGFPGVVRAIVAGIFLAGAVGLLMVVSRRAGRHDVFAYGPYLCLGALLTLLLPD
jgi:leader peptidase (prepilin peptidase)/N-methyltransferase